MHGRKHKRKYSILLGCHGDIAMLELDDELGQNGHNDADRKHVQQHRNEDESKSRAAMPGGRFSHTRPFEALELQHYILERQASLPRE